MQEARIHAILKALNGLGMDECFDVMTSVVINVLHVTAPPEAKSLDLANNMVALLQKNTTEYLNEQLNWKWLYLN